MVGIPCFDEAGTIGKVVADFRRVLPGAKTLVIDNGSGDRTGERAREAGGFPDPYAAKGLSGRSHG